MAWELFDDRRVAWAAVLAVALSPYFVLYAREAREYALWGALTLAANAQLLRALRHTTASTRRQIAEWGAFALLTALSLYTAFSAAGVILGQVLFICWRERLRFTWASLSAAGAMAVAALLFLPWALVLHARLEAFQASMAWSRDIVIPRTELLSLLASNLSRPLVDGWADASGAAWIAVAAAVLLLAVATASLLRAAPGKAAPPPAGGRGARRPAPGAGPAVRGDPLGLRPLPDPHGAHGAAGPRLAAG